MELGWRKWELKLRKLTSAIFSRRLSTAELVYEEIITRSPLHSNVRTIRERVDDLPANKGGAYVSVCVCVCVFVCVCVCVCVCVRMRA